MLSDDAMDHLEIQAKKCWQCKSKCDEGERYMLAWDQIETERYHKWMRENEPDLY